VTSQPDRSHVVILTTSGGTRVLSSTSLLTGEEAEGEASSWRRTRPPAVDSPWEAEVGVVLTAAELEEAVRVAALEMIAGREVA
jgi:hypothetical protein